MPGELTILAAVMEAGNVPWPPTVGRLMEHAPESFDNPQAGELAAIVKAMRARGETINPGIIGGKHRQFLDFITRELLPAAMGFPRAGMICDGYGSFISIALAIGIMVSDRYKGDDDNGHYVTDYNRGAIVFIVVLIPILFGISDGFTTDDERFTKPPSHTDDDDY